MRSFHNNNQLHLSGWHALSSTWQDELQEHWPEATNEVQARVYNATVVWTDVGDHKNTTSIALIGGSLRDNTTTSVMVLKDVFNRNSEKKWKHGPRLNVLRNRMGACICNGYVYIMGGGHCYRSYSDGGHFQEKNTYFDTIHRIPVSCLFQKDNNTNKMARSSWTTLSARLSVARQDCTAVNVQDRFILVIGGMNCLGSLSSVDIIDTETPAARRWSCLPHRNHLNTEMGKDHRTVVTVSAGPRLQVPRNDIGTTVLNDQIWAVGGRCRSEYFKTVEYLRYESLQTNSPHDISESIFSSQGRNAQPDLLLRHGRHEHGVVTMGQCLVVVGGWDHGEVSSAELLDPRRSVVLELPAMVHPLTECKVVEIPHQGLVVIGRDSSRKVRMESLPCVNLSLKQLKKYSEQQELSRQSSSIPSSDSPISEGQADTMAQAQDQALLRGAEVESLCHTLVFYYLFHKGGHVNCEQQQRERDHQKESLPNKKNAHNMQMIQSSRNW